MTPHDELMALAGKWEAIAHELRYNPAAMPHSAQQRESCAADLRALLDSDAFRAMVRDAERYRWLREYDVDSYLACGRGEKLDAAIDAAASGAITPTPPTSEGEK